MSRPAVRGLARRSPRSELGPRGPIRHDHRADRVGRPCGHPVGRLGSDARDAGDPLEGFPRQVARTRGFSLGVPRAFSVSPDGERVVYLRTKTGDDPVSCLWVFGVSGAKERLVFNPGQEEADADLTGRPNAPAASARARAFRPA